MEQDLFLSMGGMAWAFDIRKKVDPVTGKVIPVHWNDYTPLLIAKPCKFDFDAIPRQEGRMEELRQMFDSAREEEEQQDKAITMDISQFEKDLGAEKIYRDKACEIRYADAAAQSDELEQTASEGSSTPLEPGLELGDSSSEADTESDFGKESLSTGMRVVLDGRVEKTLGIEPVVSVTGVPGAWKWA